ncbi:MAG: polymer-forming cytoskeletal protein [Acidobacteriota bacterium]
MKDRTREGELNGYLGQGTWVKGEIHFTDTLRVDGKVTGKIISKRELIVGRTGEVEAEVDVGTLSVSGRLSGSIKVADRMEIHPNGRVYGELSLNAPTLIIEEGAVFEGSIDMGTPQQGQPEKVAEEPELKAVQQMNLDS